MKRLYLQIYLTVVAVLLLFALLAGWLFQRNLQHERHFGSPGSVWAERQAAWAELAQSALPPASAPAADQRLALLDWAQRLRLPMALESVDGERIATAPGFPEEGVVGDRPPRRLLRLSLPDGRMLLVARPPLLGRPGPPGEPPGAPPGSNVPAALPWALRSGGGLLLTLAVLFLAVAAGAYPVVRRLTRRLESLKQGVEAFGAGQLHRRVDASGSDEVAAVATSFNRAAARIEQLVRSNQSLLANASHELRSPLARMKMALSLIEGEAPGARRAELQREVDRNIRELDQLVEEVLLASRLDALQTLDRVEPVDLLALAAEEGARVDARVEGVPVMVPGHERLLRRALRNLLENAHRYGGTLPPDVRVQRRDGQGAVEVTVEVCDRGPGVPEAERERIFEPFYRVAGHAERAGGVGLGLSLVRQIAQRHGGRVQCSARNGGGSCFTLTLPASPPTVQAMV